MNLTEKMACDKYQWIVNERKGVMLYTLYGRYYYTSVDVNCIGRITKTFYLPLN